MCVVERRCSKRGCGLARWVGIKVEELHRWEMDMRAMGLESRVMARVWHWDNLERLREWRMAILWTLFTSERWRSTWREVVRRISKVYPFQTPWDIYFFCNYLLNKQLDQHDTLPQLVSHRSLIYGPTAHGQVCFIKLFTFAFRGKLPKVDQTYEHRKVERDVGLLTCWDTSLNVRRSQPSVVSSGR